MSHDCAYLQFQDEGGCLRNQKSLNFDIIDAEKLTWEAKFAFASHRSHPLKSYYSLLFSSF